MGRKRFIQLTFHIAVHCKGCYLLGPIRKSGQELTQGRDLEAGADAGAMEGAAYWLAPHGMLRLLALHAGNAFPVGIRVQVHTCIWPENDGSECNDA